MSDIRLYKVRSDLRDSKDPFRVYLNYTSLARHELRPGTPCLLTTEDGRSFMATAWNPEKQLDAAVVQVSRAFLEMHDLKLADRVKIDKANDPIATAQAVTIFEIHEDRNTGNANVNGHVDDDQRSLAALAKNQRFHKFSDIAVGMTFDLKDGNTQRTLKIGSVRPILPYKAIYKITTETEITVTTELAAKIDANVTFLNLDDEGIGGLSLQIRRIRRLIEVYSDSAKRKKYQIHVPLLRGGILLYGRPGTGKSLLLQKIAEAGWKHVAWVTQDDLRRGAVFTSVVNLALKLEPSLIIVDRLDVLTSTRDDKTSVTDAIMEAFEKTKDSRVMIIGATANIREIPESLRQQAAFQNQISVPVPDSKARAEILKVLCSEPRDQKNDTLDNLASRTHGFVGSDLQRLLVEAFDKADERIMHETPPDITNALHELLLADGDVPEERKIVIHPQQQDWENALAEIRPSAMNDVFIETPETRWSDIGGYHSIKKELRFAINLQIRYADEWSAFHVEPTKGILLYGPPGCSKTLIAKAIATEMGLNFLAVKGAEVLDKYVGESERKLRDIFDTARAASPSVIFFDEIDALGASRSHGGDSGGLHLLTTMLNELDGIEARKNVFVLAATNRPDVLDPALMRPGRLDRHVYVGLPDAEARREILEGKLARVPFPCEATIDWLTAATVGYSGAEVVDVLKEAFYFVMEERMESGRSIILDRKCFEHALGRVKRQINQEMLDVFENWGRSFAKGTKVHTTASAIDA